MSLQDDYFDLAAFLDDKPEADLLENIWFAFCNLETQKLVQEGTLTEEDYFAWLATRHENLIIERRKRALIRGESV